MGNHATALAKHKLQLAQVHLLAALEALRDGTLDGIAEHLKQATADIADADRLCDKP